MLGRISVPMTPELRAALIRLAHDERRDPRQQAAVVLEAELTRRGLLAPVGQRVDGDGQPVAEVRSA